MKKQRKTVKRRPNNTSLAIKQSQGLSVPPQGLYVCVSHSIVSDPLLPHGL